MSDSRKAIADDEDEYIWLCKKYGEVVQYDVWEAHGRTHKAVACYGEHARQLQVKLREEQRTK